MAIKGPGRASLSVTEGTLMLRSWSEADDVSLLCRRLQGLQAWLRLNEGGKIFAQTRFQICEGGCRLKFLSGELGPPASSWQVVNASDGTGRKQWNRQAGRPGRAGVRWCGRTLVGCGTGRTGVEFGSLRRGRAEALAEPGSQAAAAAAGGWGSRAGAQAQQELQDSSRHGRKRSSHR